MRLLAGMFTTAPAATRITDEVSGGRRVRMCLVCMILCTASILVFWRLPSQWDAGFLMFVVAALIGAALFAACRRAEAQGHEEA